jgi:hypothetical protein
MTKHFNLDIGYSCLPAGRGTCLVIGVWDLVISNLPISPSPYLLLPYFRAGVEILKEGILELA